MRNAKLLLLCCVSLVVAVFENSFSQTNNKKSDEITGWHKSASTQKTHGWTSLFDGKTATGWRGFKKLEFPSNVWIIQEGCLVRRSIKETGAGHGGADIITTDTFSDFELRFEWKVAPGGNSGVKYFVIEEREGPIAHEYQIVDDDRHPDARIGPHRATAAFYDVLPPNNSKKLKPAGDFNESRVIVNGNHVEHWLNGARVLEYELASPPLLAAIAKSKFEKVAGFGQKVKGHILLQDHGDQVWYRNLRIRTLPQK